MQFVEFIGFIITILAMFFILFRRAVEEKHRREHPEEYEQEQKEQERALREFLQQMNIEIEPEPEPEPEPKPEPVPRPQPRTERLVRENYDFDHRLEDYEETEGVASRKLDIHVGDSDFRQFNPQPGRGDLYVDTSYGAYEIQTEKIPRSQSLLKELPSLKHMVIYKEIFGGPKGLQ